MDYSFGLGLWKSFKNELVVLWPGILAGWAAFSGALPENYAVIIALVGGFLSYLTKNYIQVKRE